MPDGYIFSWNEEKNRKLLKERGLCFEDVLFADVLDILKNPSDKYKNQFIMLVKINDYVHIVPFVVDKDKKEIFLKTIYPSRKFNKKYNN